MTFDVHGKGVLIRTTFKWKHQFEVFCVCRNCGRSTGFQLAEQRPDVSDAGGKKLIAGPANLNDGFEVEGFVNLKDLAVQAPPEHLPEDVAKACKEGATAMAVQCWNAAGSMFRASIDLATRALLPAKDPNAEHDAPGLNAKVRRDLGLRLPWLFDHGLLPLDLKELSKCIREDGNDGVHTVLLGNEDAEDLLDFTTALLERAYTEPERLAFAERRRAERRASERRTSKK
ncbi:MAG: DUF4145 domain-containing protein [Methyloceanibacter sp.]